MADYDPEDMAARGRIGAHITHSRYDGAHSSPRGPGRRSGPVLPRPSTPMAS
jgi:hypothetical protein